MATNGGVVLFQPLPVGSRLLPVPVLVTVVVLVDVAVIKLVVPLNPFPGDGYRGVLTVIPTLRHAIHIEVRHGAGSHSHGFDPYGVRRQGDGSTIVAFRAVVIEARVVALLLSFRESSRSRSSPT